MAIDKADLDVLNDKSTIVVIPEVGEEYTIVRQYLQQFAPKVISEQRVFTELSLGSLQTDVSVVLVFRIFDNPIRTFATDKDGHAYYPKRPNNELFDEVVITAPVKVSKFWLRDNPMRPGKPDSAGILEALGKVSIPWRLDFIDKGETKPELLKLIKA